MPEMKLDVGRWNGEFGGLPQEMPIHSIMEVERSQFA